MTRILCAVLIASLSAPSMANGFSDPLPNTKPLSDTRDLARVMVDGIHAYLDRELKEAPGKRYEFWKAKAGEPIAAKRERLKKILGVVDERLPRRVEEYGKWPEGTSVTPTPNKIHIQRIRWDVLPGFQAEGLYVHGKEGFNATVIVIPDSSQTPEQVLSMGDNKQNDPFDALCIAERDCDIIIPALLNRFDSHSGNPRIKRLTNQSHREFVHRMAFEMGRTQLALDVQQVLSIVPEVSKYPIAVIGYGDGGRIALLAAALDERINVCQIAGAFGRQESIWQRPVDRNVWSVLNEFGDAELAAMIAPRKLIVDPVKGPDWKGNPSRQGRSGATSGMLKPLTDDEVNAELTRIKSSNSKLTEFGKEMVNTDALLTELKVPELKLKGNVSDVIRETAGLVHNAADKPDIVQKRLLDRQVNFVQNLWRNSEPVRKEFWKKADASSLEKWEQSCDWYRNYFHNEIIGKLPEPTMPLNPRTRQVYDEPKFAGYEVVLDVYPEVIASGILLLPKDQKPGERRPVVVCQHGLEGRPKDCIEKEPRVIYDQFARKLVEKGYVVYCPQNPYIFDDYFRQILRKANPLKLSLFSFIIRQHQRTIDWLETLPQVDPKRIAFYGLSYGGKTAMRVPAVEKRYCLSICSGDFNEWIGKIVSTELPMSYMYTKEYDMLEFNLGHTFNYAEMANLIAPRAFMVERGHDDGVGIDEMVAYEYAKVRYLYANRLKIPDRTAIEFFPGGHRINGKGTFEFLQKHLNYP